MSLTCICWAWLAGYIKRLVWFFPTSVFGVGIFFLIAPFPDLCLLVPLYKEDHYTLLHTKYESSVPYGFGEEDFLCFPMMPPGRACMDRRGTVSRIYKNDHYTLLHTTCEKLWVLWFQLAHELRRYLYLKVWTHARTEGRLDYHTTSSPCEPSAQVS